MGVIREGVRDKCGHVYGKNCIKKWLEKSDKCPLSRLSINKGFKRDHTVRRKVELLPVRS
jgi:hypothetical protein